MTLKEIREDYVRYSTNVSNLCRNSAYAGIGVIWIFKHSRPISVDKAVVASLIPKELYLPLILFISVLVIDILQYAIQTGIWYWYYCTKKKENGDENNVILNGPEIYNIIPWACWIVKLLIVIVAYFLLGRFLIG